MKFTNFRQHGETRAVFRLKFSMSYQAWIQLFYTNDTSMTHLSAEYRNSRCEKEGLCVSVIPRFLFGRTLGNNIGVNCGSWRRGELALVTSWTMPDVKYVGFVVQFPKSAGKHVVRILLPLGWKIPGYRVRGI